MTRVSLSPLEETIVNFYLYDGERWWIFRILSNPGGVVLNVVMQCLEYIFFIERNLREI